MKVTDLLETYIDNVRGKGATPYNQDVDYFGLAVKMKPSVFLSLALPIARDDASSADSLKQFIADGGKIGSPFLTVALPQEWTETGDTTNPAKVTSHEGRNRMIALLELYGDTPVETHLILAGGLRAQNLTPEMIQAMQSQLAAEGSGKVVRGPTFNV